MLPVLLVKNLRVLVRLNLIFAAFCLLIVTFGPAIAGMTYVLRELFEGNRVKSYAELFSSFWDGFCANCKQACGYSLIAAAFMLILAAFWSGIPFYLGLIPLFFFLLLSAYVFIMIVTVALKLRLILAYAAVLIFRFPKASLSVLVWFAAILAVTRFIPLAGFIGFFLITPALLGFVSFYYLYPCVRQYTSGL